MLGGRAPPSSAIDGRQSRNAKIHSAAPDARSASFQYSDAFRKPRATRNAYKMNEISAPDVRRPPTISRPPTQIASTAAPSPVRNARLLAAALARLFLRATSVPPAMGAR